jgi:hypothetical protein
MFHAARLGDATDEIIKCQDQANAATAPLDKTISDLNTGWHPTGFYTPSDLQSIITTLEDAAAKVGQVISDAPLPWFADNAASWKRDAFEEILTRWRDRGNYFKAELAKAKAAGATVINAPGAKDWVISSMTAFSDGYMVAATLHCQTSTFQRVVDGGYNLLVKIGEVVWGMGSFVANTAEGVWDASKDAFHLVAWLAKYLPYAAVGLGGYLAYVYGSAGYHRLVKRAEGPINWGRLFRRKPKQISGARGRGARRRRR